MRSLGATCCVPLVCAPAWARGMAAAAAVMPMNSRREGRMAIISSVRNERKLHRLSLLLCRSIRREADLHGLLRVEHVDRRGVAAIDDGRNELVDLVLKRMMAHVNRVRHRRVDPQLAAPALIDR